MKNTLKEKIFLVSTGVLAGTANGFFGGGGGMLVVPMLILLLSKKTKKAHATALLVILPITVVSGAIYALFGNFDWKVGLPAGIGVVVGGALGALLLKKVKNKVLNFIFAAVILAAGVKMLFF